MEGKEHMFEPGTKWVDEDGDLRATCKYCQQDIHAGMAISHLEMC